MRNFILSHTDAYVARYFGVFDDDDNEWEDYREDEQQAYAQQSDHTPGTAGFSYGKTQVDISRLDGEVYERMLKASQQWRI